MINLIYSSFAVLLLCIVSCNTEVDQEPVYNTLFTDKHYANGFFLSSTDEANHAIIGELDYEGKATATPVWKIAQWNCINNDFMNANYNFVNNKHEYRIDTEGNRLAVDVTNGTLTLELNASTEYGLNGITSNPRADFEPWPTILCEYSIPEPKIVKISDKKEIRMVIDYKVIKLEDKMPLGTTNIKLHSAQFQWYITVQNRNNSSSEFGRYIWLGLNFHDKRYDFAPFYAAQDGGKENNTGAFIYLPDMQPLMSDKGKAEVNKKFSVDINILSIIQDAFTLAQQRNFLTKTKWEDLYIGASNIGWEVPGTYDVAVDIYQFDIKYR